MSKRIDFTQAGGLSFTQDTLAFMQDAYIGMLEQIALKIGQYIILSGTQATGGWVSVLGEIMPFGGFSGNSCYVEETAQYVMFADGVSKPAYYSKRLAGGIVSAGGTQLTWTSFTPLSDIATMSATLVQLQNDMGAIAGTIQDHVTDVNNPHAVTKAQVGLGNIPNATSNNPLLNQSGVLATTAATASIIRLVDVVAVGDVGGVVGNARVTNVTNSGDDTRCKIMFPTPFSAAPRMVLPFITAANDASWNVNNDVLLTYLGCDAYGFWVSLRGVTSVVSSSSISYIVV